MKVSSPPVTWPNCVEKYLFVGESIFFYVAKVACNEKKKFRKLFANFVIYGNTNVDKKIAQNFTSTKIKYETIFF
jgi:hypothetical protein